MDSLRNAAAPYGQTVARPELHAAILPAVETADTGLLHGPESMPRSSFLLEKT